MRCDADQQAIALDHAWDALQQSLGRNGRAPQSDRPASSPCASDADLVALIAQLHARPVASPFQDPSQAWHDFQRRLPPDPISVPAPGEPIARPTALPRSHGSVTLPAMWDQSPAVPGVARSRGFLRRPSWAILQMAAVLLLVIGLGYWAVAPGRQTTTPPVVIPAPELVSPNAAPARETLLDLPLADLPFGHAVVGVDRWTLQPGSQDLRLPPLTGPARVVVESGAITAIEEGAEVPLVIGEPVLVPTDHAIAFRVTSSDDATLLVVYVLPVLHVGEDVQCAILCWGHDPVSQHMQSLIATSTEALPGGSGNVIVERLTLPPGAALSPQGARPWTWTEVGAGLLGLSLEGARLPARWTSGTERAFRHGQYLPVIPSGTQMTLRNAGDTPLVLYRLTLIPTTLGVRAPG